MSVVEGLLNDILKCIHTKIGGQHGHCVGPNFIINIVAIGGTCAGHLARRYICAGLKDKVKALAQAWDHAKVTDPLSGVRVKVWHTIAVRSRF